MTRPQQSKRVVATGCAAIFGLICGATALPRPGRRRVARGAGGGPDAGDVTPAGCLDVGALCTGGQVCCSGICDTSTGLCGSSVALCLDPGLPCQYATDAAIFPA